MQVFFPRQLDYADKIWQQMQLQTYFFPKMSQSVINAGYNNDLAKVEFQFSNSRKNLRGVS